MKKLIVILTLLMVILPVYGEGQGLSLSQEVYQIGDAIVLTGQGIEATSVQIKVTDMEGLTLHNIDQIQVQEGAVDYTFYMPDFAKAGHYKITTSLNQTLTFELKAKQVQPQGPVGEIPVDIIVSLNAYDVELDLEEGNFFDFKASINVGSQEVTWFSSDSSVAKVDDRGRVTPVGPGQAVITARRLYGTVSKTAKVTVFLVEEEATPLGAINFEKPYILGFPDGTFRPEEGITRGQMAAIYGRILTSTGLSQERFTDVSEDNWAYAHILKARHLGIFSGYADGTFKPNKPLTKGELAATFSKFWAIKDIEVSRSPVAYAYEGHWAAAYVYEMYNSQLITSVADYNPDDLVTRTSVVRMVNALIGRKSLESPTSTFQDVKGDYKGEIEAAAQLLMN